VRACWRRTAPAALAVPGWSGGPHPAAPPGLPPPVYPGASPGWQGVPRDWGRGRGCGACKEGAGKVPGELLAHAALQVLAGPRGALWSACVVYHHTGSPAGKGGTDEDTGGETQSDSQTRGDGGGGACSQCYLGSIHSSAVQRSDSSSPERKEHLGIRSAVTLCVILCDFGP